MAKPTLQQVHIDGPLTNISIAYTPGSMIGMSVFPEVPVQKKSDIFFSYTKADWLRREAAVRAPGTRAARGDYGLETDSYLCTERAIAKGVPDEIVKNADNPLRPLQEATEWTTTQLMLDVESLVQDQAFGTGWSNSATPSPLWDNDTATPIEDVETAHNTIVSTIGREATTGVIGRGLWRHLKQHPEIVDRIKYGAGPNSPAVVTLRAVAALFGLEEILVGVAIEDTADEGSSSSISYIWGQDMLVYYKTPSAALLTPNSGYVFTWERRKVERFREDQEKQDVVSTSMSWDVKLTATDAGYLIKSAAA